VLCLYWVVSLYANFHDEKHEDYWHNLIKRTTAMVKEITRYIKKEVERELWARSAGRCEFHGCNRILYKSPVTQERVNISEKAHIYSFSEEGPRGWGPFKSNKKAINNIDNLLLLCHDCHKKIDNAQDGGRYTAELLKMWKTEHEKRIAIVAGVDPSKGTCVVMYGANIGNETSKLQPAQAQYALFPRRYPLEERPISLEMSWEGKDDSEEYWGVEDRNLQQAFDRRIRPYIADGHHFSIFALAPMPLLVRLGTLFTDKIPADVYQLRREPELTWEWISETTSTEYKVIAPETYEYPPVLIISLSARIAHERITAVLGSKVSIWEITIDKPHNDFLKCRQQLSDYRSIMRELMLSISDKHGIEAPLSIFPAMPVSTSVELGRVRMPKADMPWIIYDHNQKHGAFVKALEIRSD